MHVFSCFLYTSMITNKPVQLELSAATSIIHSSILYCCVLLYVTLSGRCKWNVYYAYECYSVKDVSYYYYYYYYYLIFVIFYAYHYMWEVLHSSFLNPDKSCFCYQSVSILNHIHNSQLIHM